MFFISKSFLFLWLFHLLSLFGSEMTRFALPIWFYKQEQNLVSFSIFMCIGLLPRIFSFLIGSISDYLSPKKTLLISNLFLIFISILFSLMISEWFHNTTWLVYFLIFSMGLTSNFIHITTISNVAKIVKKESLLRGNSLMVFADSSANLLSPLLSGFLILQFGPALIIWIDICFFTLGIFCLAFVKEFDQMGFEKLSPFYLMIKKNLKESFLFIKREKNLLHLLYLFSWINFLFSLSFSFFTPMVLSFSNFNSSLLGLINSIGIVGQMIGAMIAGYMLKPLHKISTLLKTISILGLLGPCLISLYLSPIFWSLGYALTLGILAIINSINHTLWQTHSPTHLQATIFGVRRMFTSLAAPMGALTAGSIVNFPFHLHFVFFNNKYQMIFFISGILISISGLIGLFTHSYKQSEATDVL